MNKPSLNLGDQVERYLRDGDVVVINRQPSLRKKSIMAHYVKIVPTKTFQLNLACTPAYNADFDGDEMTLHVPRSIEARIEAEELMLVDHQLLNAQNNKPVFSIVQDGLLGS